MFLLFLWLFPLVLSAQQTFHCLKENETAFAYFKRQSSHPIIMAHRMSPKETGFAENALLTFVYNLANNSCSIQETDVRMTLDKKLVLLHDSTLERTTTGKGILSRLKWKDIHQYELKDKYGTILKGQHIPTLKAMLQKMTPHTLVMLDMKPRTNPKAMMQEVIAENRVNQVVVICYTIAEAIQLHQDYPKLMLALGFNSKEDIEKIKASGLPYENLIALVPQKIQSPSFYQTIQAMKVPISFSAQGGVDIAPDAPKKYKQLFTQGIGIICSDSLNNVKKAFQ